MAREEFEHGLVVAAPPSSTWKTITDVPKLVRWVGVLEDAEVVEPLATYRAVLMDRLGLFSLRAELDIQVAEYDEPTWLRARAEGEDRQMGSRIAVEVELRLAESGDGTSLTIRGVYDVTGRIATLGSSTIRRKADEILEDFFGNLSQELA